MISMMLIILFSGAAIEVISAQESITTTIVPVAVLDCPGNKEINADFGGDTASASWIEPTSNVPGLSPLSSHGRPPTTLKIGEHTITYSVTDGNQMDTCEFNITVKDNQNPSFGNCPSHLGQSAIIKEITVQGPENQAVVEFDVQPNDNAGHDNLLVETTPLQSGKMFPYGPTTVTVNATDPSGNSYQCSFYVIVKAQLEVCSSSMSDNCAPEVVIRGVTENQITMIWLTESDTTAKGQYIVDYWAEGEESNTEDYSTGFEWDVLRYPYISEQTISGLKSGTLYMFDITKRYDDGTTAPVGYVMQRTKPAPADEIVISEITSTTAKVSWNSDITGVDQFHVYYWERTVFNDVGYFPNSISEAFLTNLSPSHNTDNSITVTVETISGSGERKTTNSNFASFIVDKLPGQDDIVVKNYTETSIAFTWAATPIGQNGEPFLLYLFNDRNKLIDFVLAFPYNQQLMFPEYEFTNLQPLTSYTIRIIYNGLHNIPAFKSSLEQETRPSRIENLRGKEVLDNSFTVTWDRAKNSYPDEYRIFISPHDNSSLPRPVVVTQNEYEFQRLEKDAEYYVTVISVEEGMESIPVRVMITTGVSVIEVKAEGQDLFLPIIIGVALGVFILFLIIIIFFLLCLIPCDTVPPPQPPAKPSNQANGISQRTLTYAYDNSGQTQETSGYSSTMPPRILHPPNNRRQTPRESSVNLTVMEAPTTGHDGTQEADRDGTQEAPPGQEIYVNVFGFKTKPSLFRSKKSKIERPPHDGISGNFNRRKISQMADPQIYDDVPDPQPQYDDDFDEDPI